MLYVKWFLCYYACFSTFWLVFFFLNWLFLARQSKFPSTYYQIQTTIGRKLAQLVCTKVITHCSMLTMNSRWLSSCTLFVIRVPIMNLFCLQRDNDTKIIKSPYFTMLVYLPLCWLAMKFQFQYQSMFMEVVGDENGDLHGSVP